MRVKFMNGMLEVNYLVKWEHFKSKDARMLFSHTTVCKIMRQLGAAAPREMTPAVAQCSKKDQFCKETGRKVSLARALEMFDIPKADRAIFWKSYFDRVPEKPCE